MLHSKFVLAGNIVLAVAMITGPAAAQTEKILHNFGASGDGVNPASGLTFDSRGYLYGTTFSGGTGGCSSNGGCGTVFQLQPNGNGSWSEKVIYNFDSVDSGSVDRAHPRATLILDPQGNLYGTALCDLTYCDYHGAVYELSPNADGTWTESTLHTFSGDPDDGGSPGAIVLDAAGNLYGETYFGGVNDTGTVFELVRASGWREQQLHVFGVHSGGNAVYPIGSIARDSNGDLFGTTEFGGPYSGGVAFRVTVANTNVTPYSEIFDFTSGPSTFASGLVFGPDGNLYGTTEEGGTSNLGTVFKLTRNANGTWSQTVLYSFAGGNDGAGPTSNVTFDAAGNIFGTTDVGGGGTCLFGCGTVYKLTRSGNEWSETVLHRFVQNESDGWAPNGPLVLDSAGSLYGTTEFGGIYGGSGGYSGGVVFEVTP